MNRLGEIGRWMLAISVVAFGVQQFVYSGFVIGLTLVPRWIHAHTFWADFLGAILIVCGVGIALEKMTRLACSVLGALFFAVVLVLHVPEAIAVLHDIVERTRAFETLAICGGAFVLAGLVHGTGSNSAQWDKPTHTEAEVGRYFFSISMVVFGIDHFQVAPYIATLIPAWIPGPLFLAYFTGAAFIAAGLAIATKIQARLAAALLGLMFFSWVAMLHSPRVASQIRNGNEWNSLFVALAMAGCAFVVAASPNAERKAV
jgi:uncharacterized membrane protein YphA (DoxX/SURF4 family)